MIVSEREMATIEDMKAMRDLLSENGLLVSKSTSVIFRY